MEMIFGSTRAELLETGEQILMEGELAQIFKDQGFKVPIYMTSAAWNTAVAWNEDRNDLGQSVTGRLHDVAFMLIMKIRAGRGDGNITEFELNVMQSDGSLELVKMYCQIGPTDFDNPAPAMTIMMPDDL